MTEDLAAWLLEQIARDEHSPYVTCRCGTIDFDGCLMRPGCPDRVRAECDAKRRIIEHVAESITGWREYEAGDENDRACAITDLGHVLKLLALPYSNRPGYREEWRP